ncbi:MAG: hypothetical protein ABW044_12260 [Cellvibrio sp.]
MKAFKVLAFLTAALFIAGCASKTTKTQEAKTEQTEAKQTTVKKAEIKTIYLKISHDPTVIADGAYVSAEKELSDAIIKKIRVKIPKANIITTQKPASGIEADIVISEFSYIASATQMLAAPSNKAKLGAKLTLTDITTNKTIRKVELGTSAKFSEGIFGGTSSAQIENLADKIVARIKAR